VFGIRVAKPPVEFFLVSTVPAYWNKGLSLEFGLHCENFAKNLEVF
jgi:hypothetical protein